MTPRPAPKSNPVPNADMRSICDSVVRKTKENTQSSPRRLAGLATETPKTMQYRRTGKGHRERQHSKAKRGYTENERQDRQLRKHLESQGPERWIRRVQRFQKAQRVEDMSVKSKNRKTIPGTRHPRSTFSR